MSLVLLNLLDNKNPFSDKWKSLQIIIIKILIINHMELDLNVCAAFGRKIIQLITLLQVLLIWIFEKVN